MTTTTNFERFQDETTGKDGFRNRETGEIAVAPEYLEVSDFLYYRGRYVAFLGEHLSLSVILKQFFLIYTVILKQNLYLCIVILKHWHYVSTRYII
ncbi:MAG: hypothetical protein LBH32_00935 [Dysgonamonadaceae bacterium]|jgi:hypothetical protein|nr:hypothetical protein [Dysgonamonadaceae bacterium]